MINLVTRLLAARKHLLLALVATGACYALAVSAVHSDARAQDATKSCNSECLLKKIDTLDKKLDALEHTVDALAIEAGKSIKTGQKIILHTDLAERAAAVSPISARAATSAALSRGMRIAPTARHGLSNRRHRRSDSRRACLRS